MRKRYTVLLLCLLSVLALARLVPGLFFTAFAVPSAHIAGWWLGMPCEPAARAVVLQNEVLPVSVTQLCSGADFFGLVLALLLSFAVVSLPRKTWWSVLPLAVAVTITANTCRIVAGWYTGVWARQALSVTYWRGVHLATGIVVFLVILIATHAASVAVERKLQA